MADDAVRLLDHLGIDAGPRRRRVDGRDDRPDDGHRPPRPGPVAHLDHVDHRRPRRRRSPTPRSLAVAAAPPRPTTATRPIAQRRRGVRAIGSPGHFDEDAARRAGRRGVRPLLRPRGRRPASCSPSSPRRLPHRGARPASTVPTLVDPRRRRSARRPRAAASAPPRPIPGAELLVIEGMGHDLPPVLLAAGRRGHRATLARPRLAARRPDRPPCSTSEHRHGTARTAFKIVEIAGIGPARSAP